MQTSEPVPALRGKTINGGRINAYNLLTNTIPDRDEPNPNDWETISVNVWESNHPYGDNVNEERVFEIAGAKYMRLVVKRYDLENNYDFLVITDSNGQEVERISGAGSDYESFHVSGDSMTVSFRSDSSVNKWGFVIEEIQVQY